MIVHTSFKFHINSGRCRKSEHFKAARTNYYSLLFIIIHLHHYHHHHHHHHRRRHRRRRRRLSRIRLLGLFRFRIYFLKLKNRLESS
jgi:hypothetical protein